LRGVLGALGVVGGGDFGAVSMANESLALTTPRICTHERDTQVCCVSVWVGVVWTCPMMRRVVDMHTTSPSSGCVGWCSRRATETTKRCKMSAIKTSN